LEREATERRDAACDRASKNGHFFVGTLSSNKMVVTGHKFLTDHHLGVQSWFYFL
jgi:hypothetical protein